ncbi:CinA family nicotinamide mononucleotide deamidase-related protein [Weeksellaceae bacterium TAE3-ERU29]|nr:CinA family nicotinamide mononucleotide deamidase-related protein [Weeksellaceae bacterium TAE3-ERU29]
MQNIFAHIISIGDEVLLGDTLDTNTNFIANELNKISVQLNEISVIHDDEQIIKDKINSAAENAQIIITTGGLGPTRDDKTKYVIADLLNEDLEINPLALNWVTEYFKQILNRPLNKLTRNQALLPKSSIPLENKTGTACGIWTKYKNSIIINLPGVPYEMKHLITTQVIPKIKETFNCNYRIHQYVKVHGIPESDLAITLQDFEDSLPQHIKLAYLPHNRKIKLRLTTTGDNKETLESELKDLISNIREIIPNNIYSENADDVLEKIKAICTDKNITIGTAESFTSGLLASSLTSISGSSSYFKGGIVAYSPKIKADVLKVDKDLIKTKGVVNEETALQMAIGTLNTLNCDVAISSTGVAGPNPDEFGNEVGLAFIGIASKDKQEVHKFFYPNYSRADFTEKIADMALEKLMNFLANKI